MRPSAGALAAVGSALAYGSLAVLAKLAYAEGWNVPTLLTARFLLAALVVLPFALRGDGAWKGFAGGLLVGAVGFAGTTALYFPSLRHLPAAVASFLLYLAPVLVALLSAAFLRERLGRRGLVALGCCVAGLALLASGTWTGALSAWGVALAAGSAVAYACTILGGRLLTAALSGPRSALAVCAGAFASYALFGAATGSIDVPWTPRALLLALAIGAVATGLAMSLFFVALPRIGASRTSVILTLEPVATLVIAVAVLQEVPSGASLAGGALIVAGAALVTWEPPAPSAA